MSDLDDLRAELKKVIGENDTLSKQIQSEKKVNGIAIEQLKRKLSQIARNKIENDCCGISLLEEFRLIKTIDFIETAISIFSWESIKENDRDFFNSKRIEKQISEFGSVAIFKHKYEFSVMRNGIPDIEYVETLLCLPFVIVPATLDCYMEAQLIRPYSPAAQMKGGTNATLTYDDVNANEFKNLIVNEECVILTDFFQWSQTNANLSLTIRRAIELYTWLMADVEEAKAVNRNYIKIPPLFSCDDSIDSKDNDKMAYEVAQFMQAVIGNKNAIKTPYAKNVTILDTHNNYYGKELTEACKDYENELLKFLGIAHIRNEKKEREITAEVETMEDMYNINITKRLQLREMALKRLKRIFPDWFSNTYLKVNLDGYRRNKDDGKGDNEENENA